MTGLKPADRRKRERIGLGGSEGSTPARFASTFGPRDAGSRPAKAPRPRPVPEAASPEGASAGQTSEGWPESVIAAGV